MRFGMMAALGVLAATAGMAHGERESGKSWSVPDYSLPSHLFLAQAATPAAGATPQPDYILNACTETQSMGDPRAAWRSVDPAYMLKNYLQNRDNRVIDMETLASIKTTLLQGTTHGNIVSGTSTSGRTAYRYDPTPNYEGDDRAVFLAEFEGKVYKIVVVIKVLFVIDQNSSQCDDPKLIKVTKPAKRSSSIINREQTTVSRLNVAYRHD